MMDPAYVALGALVIWLAACAYLVFCQGYGLRDLLVLGMLAYPVLFLGRFGVLVYFFFLGKPYLGFEILAGGMFALFMVVPLGRRGSGTYTRLGLAKPAMALTLLGLVGLFSAMVHRPGLDGLGAFLMAVSRWAWPLMVVWAGIRTIPWHPQSHDRLRMSFVLVYGVLTPLIMVTSALFTQELAGIMEWGDKYTHAGVAGFARGWSPLGSTISSGFLVLGAYAFCLAQMLRGRNSLFYGVAALLSILAIGFTLSRSVLAAFVFVNVFMLRGLLRRYMVRIAKVAAAILLVAVPAVVFMAIRYDLSRFVMLGGKSVRLRLSSLAAAFDVVAERPLLGHGMGVLYEVVRLPQGFAGINAMDTIVLGGHYSALEPHNLYLLTLAETGVVGMILLLVAYVAWYWRIRKARRLASGLLGREPLVNADWTLLLVLPFFGLTWSAMFLYARVAMAVWAMLLIGLHHVGCLENEVQARTAVSQPAPSLRACAAHEETMQYV